jgi:uncharacterized membrane protein
MKLMKPLLASLGLTAVMAAVSGWALTRLPDALIPAHWAIDGRPDAFARPASVLFILPGTALALSLLFFLLPRIMPPQGDLSRSRTPYEAGWLGAVLLMLLIHLAMVATAMGAGIDILRLAVIGVAALLLVIGNYMPKMRYNYVMGVRTPWTLASERVWDRTHRFAGFCMLAAGLASLAGGLFAPSNVMLLSVLLVPLLAAVAASIAYSAIISPRVG